MTQLEFNKLAEELKLGNNQSLAILNQYQEECINLLIKKSSGRCNSDQAYDLFIEAILDFRKNILANKVKYQHIGAYIRQICWYKWLELSRQRERQRKAQQVLSLQAEQEENVEQITTQERSHEERLILLKKAMTSLSEKCQQIIKLAIAYKVSMQEIALQMNLANANVAKTTKSRCYKKLMTSIRELQGQ